ncbi:MAG: FixH family protein [Rhodomicrobium sp.]
MTFKTLTIASIGLAAVMVASQAFAAASDYEFQAISKEVKASSNAELAVRLIYKPTNKAIPGAVLFRTRLAMSPDNMADMATSIAPDGSSEPDVYRFKADLSMAGSWALKLMAKVPGESETVQGAVIVKAKD